MLLLGNRLPVIVGGVGDDGQLGIGKSQEIRVSHQVIGVSLMVRVGQEASDVMDQRAVVEELPLAGTIRMAAQSSKLVEEVKGESRNVLRVAFVVVTRAGE